MLLPELLGNPDDGRGLRTSRVGEDLTQVNVVSPPILVLDDHRTSGSHFASDDVERELTDLVLPGLQFDVQPEYLAEQVTVL